MMITRFSCVSRELVKNEYTALQVARLPLKFTPERSFKPARAPIGSIPVAYFFLTTLTDCYVRWAVMDKPRRVF